MKPFFKFISTVFIGSFALLPDAQAHNYNDQGICTDADCSEPYQPAPLQDGWHLLSNAGNVEWFSAQVNQGGNNIFLWGKMVADIDFTGVTHTPIGVSDATKFNGRFDGQGHRILNLKLRTSKDLQGFFGGLRGGGTRVSNLIIDKSCQITGKQRVGGIAAFAQTITGDPIVIENCINEANITGTSTAVGGILGGSMSPHPAIHILGCINKGIIRGSGESATIAGWLGDNAGSLVESCYNTGRLTGIDGDKRNMVRHGGSSVVRNIFDLYKSSIYTQGIKKDWVTSAPLTSGELCYFLSRGQNGDVWRQTLGSDDGPLPLGDGPKVFLCGKSNCDGSLIADESFFSNEDEGLVVAGHQFEKGHCLVCGSLQPGYAFPPRKVFLMGGQSNADGRAAIGTMPQYIQDYANGGSKFCYWSYANGTEEAWQMFGGKFAPYMPYTDNNTTSRCGFDAIVYHLIEQALHERFFVIKESRGGTAIDTRCSSTGNLWWNAAPEWLATAAPRSGHSLALEFTENIGLCIDGALSQLEEGYQIKCIMWHQGESDRTQAASYHDNLQGLVSYLRSWLVEKTGDERYATLPFIAGTVNRSSTQYNAVVEQAVHQLAEEDANFHVVDMSDCKLGSDNLHFDAVGEAEAGRRMFDKLVELGLLSEDDATGTSPVPSKGVENGREGCFDLQGRQWQTTGGRQPKSPGIYIMDGQKMLVGNR
ncbi:MAG: hypothetical protein IJ537_01550 [Bacteroidaceae bacterium]|nr:hypothetical protein [Bacteroidaceae bacterium]